MKAKAYLQLSALLLFVALGLAIGCSKAANDAQITSDIQSKLSADSGLAGKQIAVQSDKGSVTLSGVVDNDAQREAAARYAASEPGVKQVVNNLTVGAEQAEATPPPAEQQQQPEQPTQAEKPRPSKRRHHDDYDSSNASAQMNNSAPPPSTPPPVAQAPAEAPPPPPPPPPPPQKVAIPSGTVLAIRLVDAIDSETAQPGQTFHATLDSPIAVEGEVVIPKGYDVEGHVVDVRSAGKFAGQSLLKLQLDRIAVGGKYYNIQTDQYSREGTSRGKNTAEKVGAGAVIGGIIGALAGGGKGAAVGAAAGGGLGGGVQAATKGQQIKLPSETVLNFTLQSSLSVIPTTHGPNQNRQRLDSNQ